jgi:hypothetical protein
VSKTQEVGGAVRNVRISKMLGSFIGVMFGLVLLGLVGSRVTTSPAFFAVLAATATLLTLVWIIRAASAFE